MTTLTKLSVLAIGTFLSTATLTTAAQAAIIGQYTFNGTGSGSLSASGIDPNATFSTFGAGSGITPNSGNTNTFYAADNDTPTAGLAINYENWSIAALDANDYYQFTVQANAGYFLNLNNVQFEERRSGTGIRAWEVRSSLDNYTAALLTGAPPDDTNWRAATVTLGAVFQNLTTPVSFRFYGYQAEGAGGTWRLDDVKVDGVAQPVPEPTTIATGLLAVGAGRMIQRKRQKLAKAAAK